MNISSKAHLSEKELLLIQTEMDKKKKSVGIAYLMMFLLGWCGGHQFYLRKYLKGLFYLFVVPVSLSLFYLSGSGQFTYSTLISLIAGGSLALAFLLWVLDFFTLARQTTNSNDLIESKVILQMKKAL